MENNLSIILPVFNEGQTINALVDDISVHVTKHIKDFEIIIVDDGSKDNTPSIIKDMAKSLPYLKIVTHEGNKGYGYAIKSGITASKMDWIFIMDADGQFRIDAFENFWKNKQDNDFILGYRAKRNDNFYRFILGRIGNWLSNVILKKKIRDINCGFKLFKKNDLSPLTLFSTGGLINFEILHLLFKSKENYRFLQLPVIHYPRTQGKQTGGGIKTIGKIISEGIQLIVR